MCRVRVNVCACSDSMHVRVYVHTCFGWSRASSPEDTPPEGPGQQLGLLLRRLLLVCKATGSTRLLMWLLMGLSQRLMTGCLQSIIDVVVGKAADKRCKTGRPSGSFRTELRAQGPL